jgi:hypothetical protein
MKDKSTYKIVIHNPNRVDMNNDILDDNSKIFEDYKEFKSREEVKKWLLDYVEILEMI